MTGSLPIVRGTNDKPVSSDSLATFFESRKDFDGQLFIGYPIVGAASGKHPIDAIYVSPTQGVIIFDLVEGSQVGDFESRQDEAANKLISRLIQFRELTTKRTLVVSVQTITYAPAVATRLLPDSSYTIANDETLAARLNEIVWPENDHEKYELALSIIQSVNTIRRSRATRKTTTDTSRGAKLQRLEDSIATLDSRQGKAVIETVEGVQRIRGLAGSGKTIVLALKAAYLHAQHPDWRIAVTFNTRSLKGQFTRLITNFAIEQTGEEPDWGNVRVINAWGAPGSTARDGVYHQFCGENDVPYFDFNNAKDVYGSRNTFQGVCRDALARVPHPRQTYDAILVDEAQDFPPEFLRLCYSMLRQPKRLVYAYDELQNLSGAGLPSPTEIFGTKPSGEPEVSFEASYSAGAQRDIILQKCYRNSRPILVTAHALGFGTYRQPPAQGKLGLVQIFDQPNLWTDIGYRVKSGNLKPGSAVVLERTPDTSPKFLEEHSPIDDLVQFHVFASAEQQNDWVVWQIEENLKSDELRHDDIVVINPDSLSTRKNVGPIRRGLYERGIQSHVAGVDSIADVFFQPDSDSITFTGIYRAKGNEAGMVYVINANECYRAATGLASVRNRLFTAITRSKAWVRVVGVGSGMQRLAEEFEAVKRATFELRFRYPTDRERNLLQVVHRDMAPEEAASVRRGKEALNKLIDDLGAGRVRPEDLDEDALLKLRELLGRRSG